MPHVISIVATVDFLTFLLIKPSKQKKSLTFSNLLRQILVQITLLHIMDRFNHGKLQTIALGPIIMIVEK